MVDSLPFERMDQLEIYPLIGGMGDSFFEIHSNQICHDLAMKLRAKANYLYSPALIDNHKLKKAILDNNVICNVIQSASEVDLAIVGLSNPNSEISTMRQIGYISDQDVDSLFQAGAVGDINSYFFDKDGHQLDHIINDQVIGLSINEIKKINEVLVIVSDINKFDALLAALKESIFTTLIITDEIGDKLIETINEEQSRN